MPKPRPRVYIDVVQNLQKATRRGVDFNLVFHVGALLLSSQLPPLHKHTHTHTPWSGWLPKFQTPHEEEAFFKIKFSLVRF